MQPITSEPVRGTIGDMSWLRLPGLEAAQLFVRGRLPRPPIHHLIGMTPTEAGLGTMTFTMPVTPWLEDSVGIIWGGIYPFFVDAPISLSLYTGLPPGKLLTTAELSINYLRPASQRSKRLVGRARSVHLSREVGVAEATIEDISGRVMAHATTRCVIVDVPFDPSAELAEPPEPILDPPDPYLRPAPTEGLQDPSIWDGDRIETQRRFVSGALPPGPVHVLTGVEFTEVQPGRVAITIPASPWFSAGAPAMYGGAIAYACDAAITGALWSTLAPGAVAATLDLQVRFLRPVMLDGAKLAVSAEVRHAGRTIRVAQAEVIDAQGKRVALAMGSGMVIPGGIEQMRRGKGPEEIVSAED